MATATAKKTATKTAAAKKAAAVKSATKAAATKKAVAPKKAAPATATAAPQKAAGKGKTKAPIKAATKKAKGLAVTGEHKPWKLHGRTGHREVLKGFKEGDKVKFELEGKNVTGEFAYFKISPVRYPEGKLFIRYKGKLVKRTLAHVTKVA